jgi:hypothetical protein
MAREDLEQRSAILQKLLSLAENCAIARTVVADDGTRHASAD